MYYGPRRQGRWLGARRQGVGGSILTSRRRVAWAAGSCCAGRPGPWLPPHRLLASCPSAASCCPPPAPERRCRRWRRRGGCRRTPALPAQPSPCPRPRPAPPSSRSAHGARRRPRCCSGRRCSAVGPAHTNRDVTATVTIITADVSVRAAIETVTSLQ